MKSHSKKIIIISVFTLLLVSCAFVPRVSKQQNYAENCEMVTRKLTLDVAEFGINGCGTSKDPEACLVLFGIITPVLSFVVSGSVVIAGNTIHWVEYQGTCEESELRKEISKLNG